MLVLTPPDADPLLLTGANDAQLFAYSIRRFQTVSLTHLLGHFVISLVMLIPLLNMVIAVPCTWMIQLRA